MTRIKQIACDSPRGEFRYPVLVQLLKLGAAIYDQRDNVTVEGGQEASLTLTFTIDPITATEGSLKLRWRVNDQPAATGCRTVGGTHVHMVNTPDSHTN